MCYFVFSLTTHLEHKKLEQCVITIPKVTCYLFHIMGLDKKKPTISFFSQELYVNNNISLFQIFISKLLDKEFFAPLITLVLFPKKQYIIHIQAQDHTFPPPYDNRHIYHLHLQQIQLMSKFYRTSRAITQVLDLGHTRISIIYSDFPLNHLLQNHQSDIYRSIPQALYLGKQSLCPFD